MFRERGITLERQHLSVGVNPFDGALDTELVVVCGGDGSINYVVNCMRQVGINPILGIIPMGTANDMANALDIPSNPRDAAMLILNGTEHRIDCGKVNDRYFVNILSFGIFTTASQRTTREAKQQFGKLAYLKPGLDDVKDMHSVTVHIKTDKEEYEGNIYMLLAFNGITAGRMPLTRDSRVDDGLMDVIVLEKRNKVLRSYIVENDQILLFPYLKAGKYSIRITEDLNKNGIVDTGILLEKKQPEKVRFYKLEDGTFLIDIPEMMEIEQNLDVAEMFK